jgi:hypothetical protein
MRKAQPSIIIPPQKVEGEAILEAYYEELGILRNKVNERKPLTNAIRWIDNARCCEYQELTIGPAEVWEVSVANNKQHIHSSFPESDSGERIPLYLFSAGSGKALRLGWNKAIAGEVIAVFPRDATCEVTGGTFQTEPISLPGKWQAWLYAFWSFEEKGTIHYKGPGCDFKTVLDETLSFMRYDQEADHPLLVSKGSVPTWLRCNDEMQIITTPNGLCLCLSDQAFRLWRRGSGRLRRLDSANEGIQVPPFRLSEARKLENGWSLNIPLIEEIPPGVYEIILRGAIGVEDLKLPFVYLPLVHYQTTFDTENIPIFSEFVLHLSEQITIEPFENTQVIPVLEDHQIRVTLREDAADAFCALRAFSESARPVVLLLERSDIRWVRHSETGVLDWPYWPSRPEVIPIQRLEEIQDSRALVEVTESHLSHSWKPVFTPTGRLKITLRGRKSQSDALSVLMSHEASRFKRQFHSIWVIDLLTFPK